MDDGNKYQAYSCFLKIVLSSREMSTDKSAITPVPYQSPYIITFAKAWRKQNHKTQQQYCIKKENTNIENTLSSASNIDG